MSGFSLTAAAQEKSPLSEGQWFKLGITKEGIYKLTFQYLKNQGVISSATNPQHIRIFGQGGGMLPQSNMKLRPDGLQENAIFISGEGDGAFNPQDYLLFYGQGPDNISFNTETKQFDYQKNLYSDTVFYFITVGSVKGKRVTNATNLAVSSPVIQEYDGFFVFEEDKVNLLKSGRRWFGDYFNDGTTKSYPPAKPGKDTPKPYHQPLGQLVPNSTFTVSTSFVATDSVASSFKVAVNGFPAQTVSMPASSYSPRNLYAELGKVVEQSDQLNTNNLSYLDKLSVDVQYLSRPGTSNGAYLDYVSVAAKCALTYNSEFGLPLIFRSSKSLEQAQARFEINGAPSDLNVWDITVPQGAVIQHTTHSNSSVSFGTSTGVLKKFVAFRLSETSEPVSIKRISNQNLRGDFSPELVIVSHPDLLPEANRLAAFRQATNGLQVKVVTPEHVYNEFSSGAQDITAIRDYMRHLYTGGGKIRYLLLFGRGSYDYKKRNKPDYNLVPVYESYNSTHPIFSYASDDYYGFLEDEEGSWEEINSVNYSLEIGIGRLPAKTPKEAKVLVDKLIHYQSTPKNHDSWRNSVLFIADDEDNNVHHRDAENLAEIVKEKWPIANVNKIYLGAYQQEKYANGQRSPAAIAAIHKAMEKGALFVNYTGHGRYDILTDEYVITKAIFDKWNNIDKLPVFVTATCEFGQHDNILTSGAEHLLLNPTGGAIGLFTASRPVYSHTNFKINSAFYEYAFPGDSNSPNRLGDIIRHTKNKGGVELTGVVNRNFILLGDPSMSIAFPGKKIQVNQLELEDGQQRDTISAFEKVVVKGFVPGPEGLADATFDGIMEAVVYEKPASYETIEDPEKAPKMTYTIQNKAIFRGKVAVQEGNYSFSFQVPKSISYHFGKGKISMYATDTTRNTDAAGYFDEFLVGGSSFSPQNDQSPPQVKLYLNDTTFVNGEKVGQKSMLLVFLQDESGINIMNNGVDGGIIASLDDKTTFELSDYYCADLGTYTKGSLQFPLETLTPGKHTLTLTARDSYNNISRSTIDFEVSGENDFLVYNLYNYPNPFRDRTTFALEHSRAGEDIEATVYIYNLGGQLVNQLNQVFYQSLRKLEFEEWDGISNGRKLTPGIYLFKVTLRSLTDGSRAERTEKLVILN